MRYGLASHIDPSKRFNGHGAEPQPDGAPIIVAKITQRERFYSTMTFLRHGQYYCRVLEPVSMLKEMANIVHKMAALYRAWADSCDGFAPESAKQDEFSRRLRHALEIEENAMTTHICLFGFPEAQRRSTSVVSSNCSADTNDFLSILRADLEFRLKQVGSGDTVAITDVDQTVLLNTVAVSARSMHTARQIRRAQHERLRASGGPGFLHAF